MVALGPNASSVSHLRMERLLLPMVVSSSSVEGPAAQGGTLGVTPDMVL